MIAFGPVPSRRLGRSLGINNIPYKICTYSCVYCQIGKTLKMEIERRSFYGKERIFREVQEHVERVRAKGEEIDYLTFVPDGEPTLDLDLKEEIRELKTMGIPIAVITNGSLIHLPEVREALMEADFVSLKVDGVSERGWRSIDRPHRKLNLDEIMRGMESFSKEFRGKLVTETMLVDLSDAPLNLQDNLSENELKGIAEFVSRLSPDVAYLAIPTRPPAESWVRPAGEETLAMTYHIFNSMGIKTEYLIGFEGDEFASTGDIVTDILSITAVHPMREDALRTFVERNRGSWEVVEQLLREGRLKAVEYMGKRYYLRVIKSGGR